MNIHTLSSVNKGCKQPPTSVEVGFSAEEVHLGSGFAVKCLMIKRFQRFGVFEQKKRIVNLLVPDEPSALWEASTWLQG